MKQIEITTSKGRFLVVDAINNANIHTGIKLSEITEEQASEIVDKRKWIDDFCLSYTGTLNHALKSNGIYLFKNPYADKIGITDFDYHINRAEQKTFYNPYIFKIK